jgi:hypothetical protein
VKRKKMNTTKKIAIALAVLMVAAAMAVPAAMGAAVGYSAMSDIVQPFARGTLPRYALRQFQMVPLVTY